MKSEVRDRVWWNDVDIMGVMHFGRYLRFAEMAETEFFRQLGWTYAQLRAEFGIWLARVQLDANYRFPAKLDDEVVARAELVKVAGSSIRFRFPIDRACDGRRLADLAITIACLDAESLKATRTPAPLLAALRAQVVSTA